MANDRMLSFRCDEVSEAVLRAAAAEAGCAVGALVRVAAVRAAADVARDVREGRLVLRGASIRPAEAEGPLAVVRDGKVVEGGGLEAKLLERVAEAPRPASVDRAEAFRRAAAARAKR